MSGRTSNALAAALAGLLFFSILTFWVRERWAVSVLEAGLFLLAALWTLGAVLCRSPLRGSAALLPLAAAFAWGLLQLATGASLYRWATYNSALQWAAILVVFLLGLQLFEDDRRRTRFLEAALWFGFLLSCQAILQLFTTDGKIFWMFQTEYHEFVMGPFVYHNQYAAFIELLLPLALVPALAERRTRQAVMAGVMAASVVASASRAGTFLVLAETATVAGLVAWKYGGRRRHLARGGLKTAVAILLASAAVGWGVLWKRMQQPRPYQTRAEVTRSSLEMVRDRPWIGFGLGTWPTVYPGYARFDDGTYVNQAHNDWAQWAAEGGVPFFLIMVSIAGVAVTAALRTLWGAGAVFLLAHCVVDYPLHPKPNLACLMFAVLAAACAVVRPRGARPVAQAVTHAAITSSGTSGSP